MCGDLGLNRERGLTFDVDLARAGCSQAFAVVGIAAEQRRLVESCQENTASFPGHPKTIPVPPANTQGFLSQPVLTAPCDACAAVSRGDPRLQLPHSHAGGTRVPRLGRDVPAEPLHKLLRKGLFSLQKGKGRKQKSPCHSLVRCFSAGQGLLKSPS